MADLPSPVTGTEMYLSALLSELRDLRTQIDELAQQNKHAQQNDAQQNEPKDTEGTVELREPTKLAGELIPDDFPGVDSLRDSGILTIRDIPRSESYLRDIDGIGSVTARKILAELK